MRNTVFPLNGILEAASLGLQRLALSEAVSLKNGMGKQQSSVQPYA